MLSSNKFNRGIEMTKSSFTMDDIWTQLEETITVIKENMRNEQKENMRNEQKENKGSLILQRHCDCETLEIQDLKEITGSLLCISCGMVLEAKVISEEAEWCNYNNDDGTNGGASMERCGKSIDPLTPSYSRFSEISGNSKLSLLNRYISVDYKDRVLYHTKVKMTEILRANNLPENLCQQSMLLYKKFSDNKDIYRGRNKIGILAACVYFVAKSRNIVISCAKMTESFDIDEKTFSKCCKILNESSKSVDDCDNKVYKVSELIERYCISLGMSFKIVKVCKNIALSAEHLSLFTNVYPLGVIAGLLLFVKEELGLVIEKKSILSFCKTSDASMSKTFKKLKENKVKIFNYIKSNLV
jgi:transcription initiation factor TFIIB